MKNEKVGMAKLLIKTKSKKQAIEYNLNKNFHKSHH